MPSLSLPYTVPKNLPDACFVCQLVDAGAGLPRFPSPGEDCIILAHNEDDTLYIPFRETARLRAYLKGRSSAFFVCRLLAGCILFIGPEVDGWDEYEEVISL